MHIRGFTIEKNDTVILQNDHIEYVRVYGDAVVNSDNVIHYITCFEGGVVTMNTQRGVNHVAACSGSKVLINKWDRLGCCIELHRGCNVINNTDMPTSELAGKLYIDDYNCKIEISGNTITCVKEVKHAG